VTIEKGRLWGREPSGPPDRHVTGNDADLARCVTIPGAELGRPPRSVRPALLNYRPTPDADLARALGLGPAGPGGNTEVVLDVLVIQLDDPRVRPVVAVNAVEIGAVADRARRWSRRVPVTVSIDDRPGWSGQATGLLVANGQFLRGADAVPRGHPGDGWAEVNVYAMGTGTRRAMRGRLATGSHVPHPEIVERRGRRIEIETRRPVPVVADGSRVGTAAGLVIQVLPGALRLLL